MNFMSVKILATVGPASCKVEDIKFLLKHCNILRTNSSHNTISWHKKISRIIKSLDKDALHLIDIPGIKPRTNNSDKITIKKNDNVIFYYKKNFKLNSNFPYNKSSLKFIKLTKSLPKYDFKIKKFSISDGQFPFKAVLCKKNYIVGRSFNDFTLLPQKGLNIPKAEYDDKKQLSHYKKFLKKLNNVQFDAIGISYIQSKKVITDLKKIYNNKIFVSKIENSLGVKNVNEIVEASDVIMIDRGDLSAEIGPNNLFNSIIKVTERTKLFGKPLIMATENFNSMINNSEPTKSEIISHEMSVSLGSDHVMLSDETATSSNWKNIIKWLSKFNRNLKKESVLKNKFFTKIKYNNKFYSEGIWSFINDKTNYNDTYVFVSRTGDSLHKFKKINNISKSFVFTDSIKTKNLCKFWKNVHPFYSKSFRRFNTGRDVLMMVKKHKKDLFSSPSSRVICVIILNPHENSKANAIYVINEKDLKFF